MRNKKLFVAENSKFEKLTVGPLVYNVQNHPLFIYVPMSYLRHGRLRECYCECGQTVLYSENVLSTGQIKSCGCIRQAIRERAHLASEKDQERKDKLIQIKAQICSLQAKIRLMKRRPPHLRTESYFLDLEDLEEELRGLYGKKGFYSRKISPKETWDKSMEKDS